MTVFVTINYVFPIFGHNKLSSQFFVTINYVSPICLWFLYLNTLLQKHIREKWWTNNGWRDKWANVYNH